eukprot:621320-Prorocentrum_minimum.AAC.1
MQEEYAKARKAAEESRRLLEEIEGREKVWAKAAAADPGMVDAGFSMLSGAGGGSFRHAREGTLKQEVRVLNAKLQVRLQSEKVLCLWTKEEVKGNRSNTNEQPRPPPPN